MLFPAAVQGYMIDLFAQDPQRLAASLKVPLLIVQGDRDPQVGVADARRLAAGAPAARLAILPGVNHVMKRVTGNDAAADIALYRDASVPVDAALVTVIASMVTGPAGK
jgi:pimeloyl-ACP methyl ester carboxylesterase